MSGGVGGRGLVTPSYPIPITISLVIMCIHVRADQLLDELCHVRLLLQVIQKLRLGVAVQVHRESADGLLHVFKLWGILFFLGHDVSFPPSPCSR